MELDLKKTEANGLEKEIKLIEELIEQEIVNKSYEDYKNEYETVTIPLMEELGETPLPIDCEHDFNQNIIKKYMWIIDPNYYDNQLNLFKLLIYLLMVKLGLQGIVIAVTGVAGVGKTQFVKQGKAITSYLENMENVTEAWLNNCTSDELDKQFFYLGDAGIMKRNENSNVSNNYKSALSFFLPLSTDGETTYRKMNDKKEKVLIRIEATTGIIYTTPHKNLFEFADMGQEQRRTVIFEINPISDINNKMMDLITYGNMKQEHSTYFQTITEIKQISKETKQIFNKQLLKMNKAPYERNLVYNLYTAFLSYLKQDDSIELMKIFIDVFNELFKEAKLTKETEIWYDKIIRKIQIPLVEDILNEYDIINAKKKDRFLFTANAIRSTFTSNIKRNKILNSTSDILGEQILPELEAMGYIQYYNTSNGTKIYFRVK